MKRLSCPKCRGDMEEGFVAGFTHRKVPATRIIWMPGISQKHFLSGVKVDEEQRRKIGTFRRTTCGYL